MTQQLALHMPTKRMRLKTTTKLFVISVVIWAGSPAVAAPIARGDVHCRVGEQRAGTLRHQKFGPCISPKVDVLHWNGADKVHDDWPANMIMD